MKQLKKLVVVIPCLNEEETIATLIHSIRNHIPNVVVVDDGSEDNTVQRARNAGAIVLSHPHNLGKGAALKTGLTFALGKHFSWALLMDGDGQHQAADIPAFLNKAERSNASLVVGDRMHDALSIPWLRRKVNQGMSWWISRRVRKFQPDTQCGFRLVDLKTWSQFPCQSSRFEIESEMLVRFHDAGCQVEYVPIRTIGRGAHSHINPVTDTWRWLWWLAAARRQERTPAIPTSSEVRPLQIKCPLANSIQPTTGHIG